MWVRFATSSPLRALVVARGSSSGALLLTCTLFCYNCSKLSSAVYSLSGVCVGEREGVTAFRLWWGVRAFSVCVSAHCYEAAMCLFLIPNHNNRWGLHLNTCNKGCLAPPYMQVVLISQRFIVTSSLGLLLYCSQTIMLVNVYMAITVAHTTHCTLSLGICISDGNQFTPWMTSFIDRAWAECLFFGTIQPCLSCPLIDLACCNLLYDSRL